MKTKAKKDSVILKEFIVAAVSKNTNSFGLTGVVLIARDGEAYEAGTYTLGPGFELHAGYVVHLPYADGAVAGWVSKAGRIFEIPRRLPDASPVVIAELRKANWQRACKFDRIPPQVLFPVFSDRNPYAFGI